MGHHAHPFLCEPSQRPIQRAPVDVQSALFEACTKAGVQRVVQIPVLGMDAGGRRIGHAAPAGPA